MLEGIAAAILSRIAGHYIVGLDTSNIQMSVMSGDLVLENLRLKEEALEEFNLPLMVKYGYLGRLELHIPWKNLNSKPVRLKLDKILILARPKSLDEYNEEAESRREWETKQEKLHAFELLKASKQSQPSKSGWDSFTMSLVSKLISNLEVEVNSLSILYEDNVSNIERPFTVGLTLESIRAVTTNAEWKPTFFDQAQDVIYKLVKLTNLAVYWNSNATLVSTDDKAILNQLLESAIHGKAGSFQYIVEPVVGTLNLVLNKKDLRAPKGSMDFRFGQFSVLIADMQYQDLRSFMDNIARYQKGKKYRHFRPKDNSTPATNPKGWWKFALNSVLFDIREKKKVWDLVTIQKYMVEWKQYTELWRKVKTFQITEAEMAQLESLEKRMLFENICLFRSIAEAQLEKNPKYMQAAKERQEKQQSISQKFISWWQSGSAKREDLPTMELNLELTPEDWNKIYHFLEFDSNAPSKGISAASVKAKVTFQLDVASIQLRQKDANGQYSTFTKFEMTGLNAALNLKEGSFVLELKLDTIDLLDRWTPRTKFPQVFSSTIQQHITAPGGVFYARVEHFGEDAKKTIDLDYRVALDIGSIEFAYNPELVNHIVNFFKISEGSKVEPIISAETSGTSHWELLLEHQSKIDLAISYHAPTLVIPKDCTDDNTDMIICNFGDFELKSIDHHSTAAEDKFYNLYAVKLSDIHCMIANNQSDWRTRREEFFIVKPFDIDLSIQKKKVPNPELTAFKISGNLPSLQLYVSPPLLRILKDIVTKMINANAQYYEKAQAITGTQSITPRKASHTDQENIHLEFSISHARIKSNICNEKVRNGDYIDLLLHYWTVGISIGTTYTKANMAINSFEIKDYTEGASKLEDPSFSYILKTNAADEVSASEFMTVSYSSLTKNSKEYKGVDHQVQVHMDNLFAVCNHETAVSFGHLVDILFLRDTSVNTQEQQRLLTTSDESSIKEKQTSTIWQVECKVNKFNLAFCKQGKSLYFFQVAQAAVHVGLTNSNATTEYSVNSSLQSVTFEDTTTSFSVAEDRSTITILNHGEQPGVELTYTNIDSPQPLLSIILHRGNGVFMARVLSDLYEYLATIYVTQQPVGHQDAPSATSFPFKLDMQILDLTLLIPRSSKSSNNEVLLAHSGLRLRCHEENSDTMLSLVATNLELWTTSNSRPVYIVQGAKFAIDATLGNCQHINLNIDKDLLIKLDSTQIDLILACLSENMCECIPLWTDEELISSESQLKIKFEIHSKSLHLEVGKDSPLALIGVAGIQLCVSKFTTGILQVDLSLDNVSMRDIKKDSSNVFRKLLEGDDVAQSSCNVTVKCCIPPAAPQQITVTVSPVQLVLIPEIVAPIVFFIVDKWNRIMDAVTAFQVHHFGNLPAILEDRFYLTVNKTKVNFVQDCQKATSPGISLVTDVQILYQRKAGTTFGGFLRIGLPSFRAECYTSLNSNFSATSIVDRGTQLSLQFEIHEGLEQNLYISLNYLDTNLRPSDIQMIVDLATSINDHFFGTNAEDNSVFMVNVELTKGEICFGVVDEWIGLGAIDNIKATAIYRSKGKQLTLQGSVGNGEVVDYQLGTVLRLPRKEDPAVQFQFSTTMAKETHLDLTLQHPEATLTAKFLHKIWRIYESVVPASSEGKLTYIVNVANITLNIPRDSQFNGEGSTVTGSVVVKQVKDGELSLEFSNMALAVHNNQVVEHVHGSVNIVSTGSPQSVFIALNEPLDVCISEAQLQFLLETATHNLCDTPPVVLEASPMSENQVVRTTQVTFARGVTLALYGNGLDAHDGKFGARVGQVNMTITQFANEAFSFDMNCDRVVVYELNAVATNELKNLVDTYPGVDSINCTFELSFNSRFDNQESISELNMVLGHPYIVFVPESVKQLINFVYPKWTGILSSWEVIANHYFPSAFNKELPCSNSYMVNLVNPVIMIPEYMNKVDTFALRIDSKVICIHYAESIAAKDNPKPTNQALSVEAENNEVSTCLLLNPFDTTKSMIERFDCRLEYANGPGKTTLGMELNNMAMNLYSADIFLLKNVVTEIIQFYFAMFPSDPQPPDNNEHLAINFPGTTTIHLISQDQHMPLFRLQLNNLGVVIDNWSNSVEGKIKCNVQVSDYDINARVWETAILDWPVRFNIQRNLGAWSISSKLDKQTLHLNLTHGFIGSCTQLHKEILLPSPVLHSKCKNLMEGCPYIKNGTGAGMWIWFDDDGYQNSDLTLEIPEGDLKTVTPNMQQCKFFGLQLLDNFDPIRGISTPELEAGNSYSIPLANETKSINLVCMVYNNRNTFKCLEFRSNLVFHNHMQTSVDLVINLTFLGEDVVITVLPASKCYIPIHLVQDTNIRLRPHQDQYSASEQFISTNNLPNGRYDRNFVCTNKENPSAHRYMFGLEVETNELKQFNSWRSNAKLFDFQFHIRAPLVIANLLPYTMRFKVVEKKKLDTVKQGEIAAGQDSEIHLGLDLKLCLSALVPGFQRCSTAKITGRNCANVIYLQDALEKILEVSIENVMIHNNSVRRVSLYTPIWLFNCTGMVLKFAKGDELAPGQADILKHFRGKQKGELRDWRQCDSSLAKPILYSADNVQFQVASLTNWTSINLKPTQDVGYECIPGVGQSKQLFEFGITVHAPADPKFWRTKIATLIPRYTFINRTGRPILVFQTSLLESIEIPANSRLPFHWPQQQYPKTLQIRFPGFQWSSVFDLENLGIQGVKVSTSLYHFEFVYVDIRLVGGMNVVLFVLDEKRRPAYIIENNSPVSITLRQKNCTPNYVVQPSQSIPFGWDDLTMPHCIEVEFEFTPGIHEYWPDEVVEHKSVVEWSHGSPVKLKVRTYFNTQGVKVFSITSGTYPQIESPPSQIEWEVRTSIENFTVTLFNQSNQPLLLVQAAQLRGYFMVSSRSEETELIVNSFQVANLGERCQFPAVLYKNEAMSESNKPFVELKYAKLKYAQEHLLDHYDYCSILLQGFTLKLDSLLVLELLALLELIQQKMKPNQQVDVTQEWDSLVRRLELTDSSMKMIYFRDLWITPIVAQVSFVNNPATQAKLYKKMSVALGVLVKMGLANIDEAKIQLKGLHLKHAYTTQSKLVNAVTKHYQQQAVRALLSAFGSLDFLGNPVQLTRSLGAGVYDFFHEPAKGLTESPQAFVRGLGKGTTSLAKHTVHGIETSASKLANSIANVAHTSMGDEYLEERHRHSQRKPQGVGEGLAMGAKQLGSGLFRGVSGILVEPVKGTKNEGVEGFFKGVGRGLLGTVVKPTTGLVDFASRTVQGIHAEITKNEAKEISRRTPEHSPKTTDGLQEVQQQMKSMKIDLQELQSISHSPNNNQGTKNLYMKCRRNQETLQVLTERYCNSGNETLVNDLLDLLERFNETLLEWDA